MKINNSYPNLSIYKPKPSSCNTISPLKAPYSINNDIAFGCRHPKFLYHITTESNYEDSIKKLGLFPRKDRLSQLNAVFTFDSLSQIKHWHCEGNNFALQVLANVADKLSSITDKFVLLKINVDSDILKNLRVRNVNDAQNGTNLEGFPVKACSNIKKSVGKGVEYFSLVPIPADKIGLTNSASFNDFLSVMKEQNKKSSNIVGRFFANLMKEQPAQETTEEEIAAQALIL